MKPTPKPLPAGVSLGLLFSSLAWLTLSCALAIVLPRSSWWHEQTGWLQQAMYYAPYVLGGVGALAAWWAAHELSRSRRRLTGTLAVFFLSGTTAVLVGLPLQKNQPHHWPLPELAFGAILAIITWLGLGLGQGKKRPT